MARAWGDPDLFAQREHAHLRLATVLEPAPRRRVQTGGRGQVAFPDREAHAKDLRSEANSIVSRHRERPEILGIDPDLVLIVELSGSASGIEDLLRPTGLEFLAATGSTVVAAFATDPELNEFHSRLAQYAAGVQGDAKSARHEALFDRIVRVRAPGLGDILDGDLQATIAETPDAKVRIDLQCWCPEPESDARRRFDETIRMISLVGGDLIGSSFRYRAGLSLVRAELTASAVESVVAVGRVRRVGLLPQPSLSLPQVLGLENYTLPVVVRPGENAPILAVIDSGIRKDHPLIAPAVIGAHFVGDGISDAGDSHGHGTFVASLALYGQLESLLDRKAPMQAAGRLLSVRVLDDGAEFPDADIWAENLAAAIEWAANRGAKVVNLSLGDIRHPYMPPMPDPVAAMVDELIRRHGIVVVISAGNFPAWAYDSRPEIADDYLTALHDHAASGILPPAPAALALTVGGLVADWHQGAAPLRQYLDVARIGKPGRPSPITRLGPGVESMIKPDLVAPAGTYSYDSMSRRVSSHPQDKVIGAAAKPADRLFAADAGTSFAAPLVSHAALRVWSRYPFLTHNGVRALLLATAEDVEPVMDGGTATERRDADLRLSGFGRVSARQAEYSEDYRTVLLAEEALGMDQVHFYSVPTPTAFFEPGSKMISIGLAFDPQVRATRLAYLASRMSVYVYRGVRVEEVRAKYASHQDDDAPPEELDKYRCREIQPPDRRRLRGANQAAAQVWEQRWDEKYRGRLTVVVRSTNRWAVPDEVQKYGLAVVLRVAEGASASVYADLRAELPLLAEVEAELEF